TCCAADSAFSPVIAAAVSPRPGALCQGAPGMPETAAVLGEPARDDIARERRDRPGDLPDGLRRDARRGEGGDEAGGDPVEVSLADPAPGGRLANAGPLVEVGTAERGGEELDLPALEFRHVHAGEKPAERRVIEHSHVEVVHDGNERWFPAYRVVDADFSRTS